MIFFPIGVVPDIKRVKYFVLITVGEINFEVAKLFDSCCPIRDSAMREGSVDTSHYCFL